MSLVESRRAQVELAKTFTLYRPGVPNLRFEVPPRSKREIKKVWLEPIDGPLLTTVVIMYELFTTAKLVRDDNGEVVMTSSEVAIDQAIDFIDPSVVSPATYQLAGDYVRQSLRWAGNALRNRS